MKKEYRLKNKIEIQNLISLRNTLGSKYFIIYYKINETGSFRIGINASKKCGNAVVRNNLKRRVRSILQPKINQFNNYDLFIVAKPNCVDENYTKLNDNLLYILKKGKITK